MKKRTIGYIFDNRFLTQEDKLFINSAKKNNVELILFNLDKDLNEEEIEEKAKKCDIIFNNSGEEFAIEIIKTLEELGKKVICSSRDYYNTEDKWLFYLKCKKHKIPTPKTILLSENLNHIKKELIKFNIWPVILKRIEGTCGDYVNKAYNIPEALKIIKKFWGKGNQKLPIIAQELIKSSSYRILVIDNKIVQAIIKRNRAGWKSTGVYQKRFKKFIPDANLKNIVAKLLKITGLKICGIDLLKKGSEWEVLEINSSPGLDFIKSEQKKIIEKIINYLRLK